jgi:sugar (pentulose or hexulose) kinase
VVVAGVDISTQATKVVIVDPDAGRVVASGPAAHEVTGFDGSVRAIRRSGGEATLPLHER